MTDHNKNTNDNSKKDTAVLPTANGQSSEKRAGITSKMETVKSAWDKAPEGEKKANALKHYQSAEKAQKSGNDKEAFRELEEATKALS